MFSLKFSKIKKNLLSKNQHEIDSEMFDLIQQTKKSHSFENFFGYENSIDEKLIIDVEPAILNEQLRARVVFE